MINHIFQAKNRNQRKREAVKTAVMAVMLLILCALLTVWALGVWAEHPGEQLVTGNAYRTAIENGGRWQNGNVK